MPVSEDEFERPVSMVSNQANMSKAEQRKSNKPIMEKRRRARINHCLNELKTLILDAMKKDPARHSKLEKADILEMTVKHLQQIQRQQLAAAVATDPTVIMRFKSGFDECAAEVSRYIGRLEGVDSRVKQRLTAHLHRCVSSLQQMNNFPPHSSLPPLPQHCDKSALVVPSISGMPGDVNNNSNQSGQRIQIPTGLQLIPSRLPTGELALLVPNANQMSSFLNPPQTLGGFPFQPGSFSSSPTHTSAFTAVARNQEKLSPAPELKTEPTRVGKTVCAPLPFLPRPFLDSESSIQRCEATNPGDSADDKKPDKINILRACNNGHSSHNSRNNHNSHNSQDRHRGEEGTAAGTTTTCHNPTLSRHQQNAVDSSASSIQTKENCFKAFHVEIPNSHLKAHISIPKSAERLRYKSPPLILQKPNPNLSLNPNRPVQKSPHKFAKNTDVKPRGIDFRLSDVYPNSNYDGFERFSKIEPLSIITSSEKVSESSEYSIKQETNINLDYVMPSLERTGSAEPFQNLLDESSHKNNYLHFKSDRKRPLSAGSNETVSPVSPSSSSASPSKMPKFSLNLTLTEDYSKANANASDDRCQRISVIVEDVSRSGSRNASNDDAVPNRDMWRPW